jgi:hypothetical protein
MALDGLALTATCCRSRSTLPRAREELSKDDLLAEVEQWCPSRGIGFVLARSENGPVYFRRGQRFSSAWLSRALRGRAHAGWSSRSIVT